MRARHAATPAATWAGVLAALLITGPAAMAPARASDVACDYDVAVSPDVLLDVQVACDRGVAGLAVPRASTGAFATVHQGEQSASGFSARYRVDLKAMARDAGSIETALAVGDSILAVGGAWLLGPRRDAGGPGALRVRVHTPASVGFATGQPVTDGAFHVPEDELRHAGFSAFGRFRSWQLTAPGRDGGEAAYTVHLLDGSLDVGHAALLAWIRDMVAASVDFWHGFPADGLALYVVPRAGRSGVPFGRAMAGGGVSMVLYVGEHATGAELRDDWVLIHELVHLGSPFIFGAPWFSEGLATYFEPLIRARSGLQTPRAMWTEFMTYMPRGAGVMADAGLARGGFRGWYWGGALLMLLADVELRRASGGRTGLEDCLRGVRRDMGDYRRILDLERMVAACDAAVGGTVVGDLVQRHGIRAAPVDLDRLWRELGLALDGGTLTVRDDAPLAPVREAIVRGGPP